MKKSTRIILIVVGALIVLAVIAKFTILDEEDAIRIDTTQVVYGSVSERVTASGIIYPVEELRIAPDVSGEIIKLFVEEGDSVLIGQLLAKIRPDNYINALERQQALVEQQKVRLAQSRSDLASAQANLIPIELDYKRKKKLYEEQVISSAELENAQAAYDVRLQNVISGKQQVDAQQYALNSVMASLREAQQNLRLTNLLAPISGRVTRLLVQEGERVVGTSQMAGTTMFHIGNLDEMDIHANVIENDVIRINVDDTASIEIESFAHLNRRFKGVVGAVATSARQKTNPEEVTEFKVEIRILRSSYEDLIEEMTQGDPLRPGMTASVEIFTETKENVLLVPLSAVTIERKRGRGPGNQGATNASQEQSTDGEEAQEIIYVYDSIEGVVKVKHIKTGLTGIKNIEVIEGIEDGEIIITGPPLAIARQLKEGKKVKVRSKENGKG